MGKWVDGLRWMGRYMKPGGGGRRNNVPTLQFQQGFLPVPLQVVQVLPSSGLACRRAMPLLWVGGMV